MNRYATKALSVLTVLAMLITLFSGMFTVSAAETSNWGTRHEVCTELSSQAQSYYTGSYTYASLSSKSGSNLLTALRTLTTNEHTKETSYSNCESYAYRSDCQNRDGTVVLLYTNYVAKQSDGWNREHVWPKSLGDFNTSGPGADMHHIRPTDPTANSTRNNNRFGEVSGGKTATGSSLVGGAVAGTYGDGYFEPLDNVKGDVARICLYMYVRYGGISSYTCDDITNVFSDINTLLNWNKSDPVDTWEMGRNDVVEGIQGNRNPFIDYPELAWPLFSKSVPTGLTTPSGGVASSYTISAYANNTSYGTVSVSGSVITATPKAGYYVSGYTLVSGTATVTQDGNSFFVNATSNCSIRINFAAKATATITFKQNGTTVSTTSGYSDDVVTLPSYSGTVPTGFKFVGWVKNTVSKTTAKPSAIYAAGSSYTMTASETFYALYAESDGSGSSGEYELFSGTLTEGDYILTYNGGAMQAADADNSGRIDYVDITVTNDTVVEPDADLVWHIAPTSDGYYTIYNETNAVYAAGNGTKNKASLISSVTDYAKWSLSGTSTYDFTNLGNKNAGVNAILRRNSSYGFACYAGSTGGALTLYKGGSGTTYYSTSAATCAHSSTTNVAAVAATCTSVGYTAGVYCNNCKTYISGHTEIPMIDHSYASWTSNKDGTHSRKCVCGDTQSGNCTYTTVVTAPTATAQGYTTYTCSTCAYSYKDNYTSALGYPVTITFSVPNGVSTPASQSAYVGNTVTLPAVSGTPTADLYAYKFVGWVAAKQEAGTAKPTIYPANSQYTVTSAQTLYALYSYTLDGQEDSGNFELLTQAPSNWEGEYVLANANAERVFLTDGTTPNSTAAAVTLANSGITLSGTTMTNVSDRYILVVESVGSSYALRLKGANSTAYLMTSNSNDGLNTATSADASTALWSLSIDSNGAAVIKNVSYTGRSIRYNSSSKQFRTYTSGQTAVYLYAGSTVEVYYTTQLQSSTPEVVTNTALNVTPNISIGAEIQVMYTIMAKNLSSYKTFYLEVSKTDAGGDPIVTTYGLGEDMVKLEEVKSGANVVAYRAIYTGIGAKNIGDEFTTTLYAVTADGIVNCGVANTTSIKSYLMGKITDTSSPAVLKTLAVDMLNYGAAAQVNFNYDAENLVNADLTSAQKALGTQTEAAANDIQTISGTGAAITASVSVQNKVFMYLTVRYAATDASKVKFIIKDAEGKIITELIPTALAGGKVFQASYDGVGAKQMREPITIEMQEDGKTVSQSLTWSVESYVAQTRASSATSENLMNMVDALLIYGDSAAAYLA